MFTRGFKTWCENVALEIRRELDLPNTDPLRPSDLARYLTAELLTPGDIPGLSPKATRVLLKTESDTWSAVTVSYGGRNIVIYNPTHSPARQSSDIMHELSHLVIGHDPSQVLLSQDGQIALRSYNQLQEQEAAWLSGCLLLPRDVLLYIKRSGMESQEACRVYGVSRDLLTFRLNASGVNLQFERERKRAGRTGAR